jgi:hypothetical protein
MPNLPAPSETARTDPQGACGLDGSQTAERSNAELLAGEPKMGSWFGIWSLLFGPCLDLGVWDLVLWICFGFRASRFGFQGSRGFAGGVKSPGTSPAGGTVEIRILSFLGQPSLTADRTAVQIGTPIIPRRPGDGLDDRRRKLRHGDEGSQFSQEYPLHGG